MRAAANHAEMDIAIRRCVDVLLRRDALLVDVFLENWFKVQIDKADLGSMAQVKMPLPIHSCIHLYIHTCIHNIHTLPLHTQHTYMHTCTHTYIHTTYILVVNKQGLHWRVNLPWQY